MESLCTADRSRVAQGDPLRHARGPAAVADQVINVTLRAGCAFGWGDSADTVVQLADICLCRAKRRGRNHIVTAARSASS